MAVPITVRSSTRPPKPQIGGHYTQVQPGVWNLIHATGPGQWAKGPPTGGAAAGQKGGGQGAPAPSGGGGLFNPSSTFGLNTGDKTAFNLYGLPKTQGDFNKQVLQAAQPLYQPQLQAIQGQETSENNLFGLRKTDIGSIYDQYQKDAQAAYDKLKNDFATINQTMPGATQAANYGAAIQSALGGQNALNAATGQAPTDTAAAAAPYAGASEAQAAVLQRLVNAGQSAALQVEGGNLANVPLERKSQLTTEEQRHLGQEQQYGQQKQQLSAQIPGIIAKARNDLITQLQAGQGQQFQQTLANKQFGESVRAAKAGEKNQAGQLSETKRVDTANIEQGKQKLSIDQQNADTNAAQVKQAATDAIAKTKGDTRKNALIYLQSALTPPPDYYHTETTTDNTPTLPNGKANPNYGKKTTLKVPGNAKTLHYDVGSILKTLVTQFGIPQDQALQMMSSIGGRTNVTGQSGQTVADWANTFRARITNRAPGTPGSVSTIVSSGIKNKFGNLGQ
jgi:hypothetical protein